jgi:tRNA threonylcarbamoyladenosine modification (KEOPS) complex  Pcc1 subunit
MTPRAVWSASVLLATRGTRDALVLERSLRPEIERRGFRSTLRLRRAGTQVRIEVRSADTAALRATLNTLLAWIHLVRVTQRVARPVSPAATHRSG